MKSSFFLATFFCSLCYGAEEYQELTLDKLKNKKVIEMSIEEFDKLKQQDEYKKNQKKFQNVEVKEVVMDNGNDSEEIIAVVPEKKIEQKTVKAPIVAVKETVKEPVKTEQVEKVETKQVLSFTDELNSLPLSSAINYFLNSYKELSLFNFEQSKSILVEKIKLDKRFDKEVLASMNPISLNKIQFIDFLNEIKSSIQDR